MRRFSVLGALLLAACSSAPKTRPELDRLAGKKIALAPIGGDRTAAQMAEVAIVNELIKRGDFELISKKEFERARSEVQASPLAVAETAKRLGADILLKAEVRESNVDTEQGFDRVETEDSALKDETGNGMTDRLVKVKRLTGRVTIYFEFQDLATGETRSALETESEELRETEERGAIRLPPKLRFLERVVQKTVTRFFDQNR